MLSAKYFNLIYVILFSVINANAQRISQEEYKRLISLSVHEFDRTERG